MNAQTQLISKFEMSSSHPHQYISTAQWLHSGVRLVVYDIVVQTLDVFQTAFAFTLGLTTHEIIKSYNSNGSTDYNREGLFVSWAIFLAIGGFVLPFIKLQFLKFMGVGSGGVYAPVAQAVDGNKIGLAVNMRGYGSSHQGYAMTGGRK
jgi:hypothetical protein